MRGDVESPKNKSYRDTLHISWHSSGVEYLHNAPVCVISTGCNMGETQDGGEGRVSVLFSVSVFSEKTQ